MIKPSMLQIGDKVVMLGVNMPSLLTVLDTTMGLFFRKTQYILVNGGYPGWHKASDFKLVERNGESV